MSGYLLFTLVLHMLWPDVESCHFTERIGDSFSIMRKTYSRLIVRNFWFTFDSVADEFDRHECFTEDSTVVILSYHASFLFPD